jgi:hypothetical protein
MTRFTRWANSTTIVSVASLGVFTSLAVWLAATVPHQKWPTVRPAQIERTFSNLAGNEVDTPLLLPIRDTAGSVVYRLDCHNGNYENDSEYTYSGDFHCALFAVSDGRRASWTLLAEDTPEQRSSDSQNRGRMFGGQLRGQCSPTPWGTVRTFRMRRMRVTINFANLAWRDDLRFTPLAQFSVGIQVEPDADADERTSAAIRMDQALLARCTKGG